MKFTGDQHHFQRTHSQIFGTKNDRSILSYRFTTALRTTRKQKILELRFTLSFQRGVQAFNEARCCPLPSISSSMLDFYPGNGDQKLTKTTEELSNLSVSHVFRNVHIKMKIEGDCLRDSKSIRSICICKLSESLKNNLKKNTFHSDLTLTETWS